MTERRFRLAGVRGQPGLGRGSRWILGALVFLAVGRVVGVEAKQPFPQEVRVHVSPYFMPSSHVRIYVNTRNVHTVTLSLYRLPLEPTVDDETEIRQWRPSRKNLVRSWAVSLLARGQAPRPDLDLWYSRDFHLPRLPRGRFLLYVRGGQAPAQKTILRLSNLALVAKTAPGHLLVFAVDLVRQQPAANVHVCVRAKDGKSLFTGKTDASGLFRHPLPMGTTHLRLFARRGRDAAWLETGPDLSATAPRVYFYTERPLYRPGQTVFFKGVVRAPYRSGYRAAAETEYELEVRDSRENVLYRKNGTTNRFGSFSGSLKLPRQPPLGRYTVVATVGKTSRYFFFHVEEYRKPVFTVRVAPEATHYVGETEAVFQVSARYFFGAPVQNAKVHYLVRARPRPIALPQTERLTWLGPRVTPLYPNLPSSWQYRRNPVVAEGVARTDKQGRARLVVKTHPHDYDALYAAEVTVTDAAHRQEKGEGYTAVMRANLIVAVESRQRVVRQGEAFPVRVWTYDFAGKPVAAAIKLSVQRLTGEGRKRRYETVAAVTAHTDARGVTEVRLPAPVQGRLWIRADAADAANHPTAFGAFVWAVRYGGQLPYRYPSIELVADRDAYRPGDTARILINTNRAGRWALFTLEADRLYWAKVKKLQAKTTTLELPIRKDYLPNVYLRVSFIESGYLLSGSVNLRAPTEEHFLKVEVRPDRTEARPGDTVTYTVRIADAKGRPASAEFSLGVVDARLYALRKDTTPDIRTFFWGSRADAVSTDYSIPREIPGGAYQRVEEKVEEEIPVELRKEFRDTAYWNAHLATDGTGEARVTVKLPDNLTKWRATVRAISRATQVGAATRSLRTRKDVMLRLLLPRFFVEGDQLTLHTQLHNDTGKSRTFRVSLSVQPEGAGTEKKAFRQNRTLEAAAGDVCDADWRPFPKGMPRCKRVTVIARVRAVDASKETLPNLSDGVVRVAPVLPKALPCRWATAGVLRPGKPATIELPLPPRALDGKGAARVVIRASLASVVMDALHYLRNYPYGCAEQTLNRFTPLLAAQPILPDSILHHDKLVDELPSLLREGLSHLYALQNGQGGWGWWAEGESHPYLTALALAALGQAKQQGYPVSQRSLQRATPAAHDLYEQQHEWAAKAALLYGLSFHSVADLEKLTREVYENRTKLSSCALALLALSLEQSGRRDAAVAVVDELRKQALVLPSGAHWEADESTYGWLDSRLETTAYALRALLGVRRDDPLAPKVILWLLHQRTGDHWRSTKETGAITLALCDYLRQHPSRRGRGDVQVRLNGQPAARIALDSPAGSDSAPAATIPVSRLRNATNMLSLQYQGEGEVYYAVDLHSALPLDEADRSADNAIAVVRRFEVRDASGRWRPLSGPLKSGDLMKVVIAAVLPSSSEFVVLEEPLPAGFEYVGLERNSSHGDGGETNRTPPHRDVRDQQVAHFVTRAGEVEVFSYLLRAETPGVRTVLPARVELMYRPDVRGYSAPQVLRVAP